MAARAKGDAVAIAPSTQGKRVALMSGFLGGSAATLLFVTGPISTVLFGVFLGIVSVLLLELELLFTRTASSGTVMRFMKYIIRTPAAPAAESSKVR
jgi:hypothetical protein